MLTGLVLPATSPSDRRIEGVVPRPGYSCASHAFTFDAGGQIDRDRRARGEHLREPQVGVGEPGVVRLLVVRHDHAERAVADAPRDQAPPR